MVLVNVRGVWINLKFVSSWVLLQSKPRTKIESATGALLHWVLTETNLPTLPNLPLSLIILETDSSYYFLISFFLGHLL